MISIIIIILAAVVIYVGIAEGQWIVSVVFGGIALLLLLMIAAGHEDDRAYVNFVRYWARGGPDRERRPRKKSRREIREEQERAERARESYKAILRDADRMSGARRQEQSFVCHYCGRFVRAVSDTAYTEEGRVRVYRCPKCGRQNMTKV